MSTLESIFNWVWQTSFHAALLLVGRGSPTPPLQRKKWAVCVDTRPTSGTSWSKPADAIDSVAVRGAKAGGACGGEDHTSFRVATGRLRA